MVIASRPGPAAVAMGALRSHPPVVRIFWGHDIHSRRLASQRVVRGDGDGLAARVTALMERAAWEFYALAGGYRLASLGLQRAWSTVRACFPAPSARPWVFTAFTGLTALTSRVHGSGVRIGSC